MPRGDRWYLAVLIAAAVIAFLPWTRATHVGGLSLFGWMMAGLMVLSPAIALVRIFLAPDERARRR
jgi:apolipoprotein N-acyltransferase